MTTQSPWESPRGLDGFKLSDTEEAAVEAARQVIKRAFADSGTEPAPAVVAMTQLVAGMTGLCSPTRETLDTALWALRTMIEERARRAFENRGDALK